MNHRGWHPAILGLLMLLIMAGCSGARKPEQPSPTPAASNAPTTPIAPKQPDLILATTTSTQDSGLLDVLVPMFEQQTGYRVKVIAVGTGQALAMGERGEADVLLVHSPAAEKQVVEKGAAINRRLVAHNDFIIVGPPADPAGVKRVQTALDAFKRIAEARATFVSRGDDSGTHKMEKEIWKATGLPSEGAWYLSSGSGMGQTLRIASEKSGYTLTDRATFLANRASLGLDILLQGDAALLNIYHVMQVNPDRFTRVNADGGKAFADFLLAPHTQEVISAFDKEKYGQPLFFADGGKTEQQLTGRP